MLLHAGLTSKAFSSDALQIWIRVKVAHHLDATVAATFEAVQQSWHKG